MTSNVLKVLVPLECTCMPLVWQTFLNLSPVPCIRDNNGDVHVVAVGGGVVVVSLSGVIVVIGVLVRMTVPFKLILELVQCPILKLSSM